MRSPGTACRARVRGVVLAGGSGRRLGGDKARVRLAGAPLLSYPVAAMHAALGEVTVLAKADTRLPELAGATVRIEASAERHPLVGLREAIGLAAGAPVLVCAGDMPFVDFQLLRSLADADPGAAPAVVAAHGGELQPLLGCYQPAAARLLPATAEGGRLRELIAEIGPRTFEVADPLALFNVNTPEDLAHAEELIANRR